MQKEEAKRLLATVHDELLQLIEGTPKQVDPAQLIDALHDAASLLARHSPDLSSLTFAPCRIFDDAYREIALNSIDSYSDSNREFAKISDLQRGLIEEREDNNLTQRFMEIQASLTREVERAGEIITMLTDRIHELESKVSIDPLTKVYNRRAMEHYLARFIEHNNGGNTLPMHLMMIDIDNFKSINDTYGHIAGDKILILLANLLKKTLRDSDKIFRYGGEEFIVALNRVSTGGVQVVAERINVLMRKNRLKYRDREFGVTLSLGVTMMQPGDTIESLVERADRALYQAKANGKDQICVE